MERRGDYEIPRATPPLRVMHFRRIFSQPTETFIYDQIMEMDGHPDVDAHVLCLLRVNETQRPFKARALLRIPHRVTTGAGRVRMPAARKLWQSDSILWPLVRRKIRPLIQDVQPDVILSHFGPDGYLMGPVAERLGIPLAVGFYGYDISRLLCGGSEKRWRRRYKRLFDQAPLLVAISNHVAGRLTDLGAPADKIRVLPLGCRLEQFERPVDGIAQEPDGECRFVHVGRLTAKKAPLVLLRAFAHARELTRGRVALQLTVVGDGELARDTEEERRRLDLEDCVELAGQLRHEEVARALASSHVYVQHCVTAPDGDQEGQGLSFVEASAGELPIVTTNHAGIADVVVDGSTGLLSPEGDAVAMGENLAALALDPVRRRALGSRGREYVFERFDLKRTTEDLLRELRRISISDGTLVPSPGVDSNVARVPTREQAL